MSVHLTDVKIGDVVCFLCGGKAKILACKIVPGDLFVSLSFEGYYGAGLSRYYLTGEMHHGYYHPLDIVSIIPASRDAETRLAQIAAMTDRHLPYENASWSTLTALLKDIRALASDK